MSRDSVKLDGPPFVFGNPTRVSRERKNDTRALFPRETPSGEFCVESLRRNPAGPLVISNSFAIFVISIHPYGPLIFLTWRTGSRAILLARDSSRHLEFRIL